MFFFPTQEGVNALLDTFENASVYTYPNYYSPRSKLDSLHISTWIDQHRRFVSKEISTIQSKISKVDSLNNYDDLSLEEKEWLDKSKRKTLNNDDRGTLRLKYKEQIQILKTDSTKYYRKWSLIHDTEYIRKRKEAQNIVVNVADK